MRRRGDRSQNGSNRRVGAQEAGVRGDSRRRGTPPHSQPGTDRSLAPADRRDPPPPPQPGTDRSLAPVDRRDRRFAGKASGLAETTSHHRPPRLTSRRMTRRIMAPMVATMIDDTMPAPRWMPNWGNNQLPKGVPRIPMQMSATRP